MFEIQVVSLFGPLVGCRERGGIAEGYNRAPAFRLRFRSAIWATVVRAVFILYLPACFFRALIGCFRVGKLSGIGP